MQQCHDVDDDIIDDAACALGRAKRQCEGAVLGRLRNILGD